MTKFINKADCKFERGYIVKDDEIIGVAPAVAYQLGRIDTWLQKIRYLEKQPEFCPPPSLSGFEPKHMWKQDLPMIETENTPTLDAAVDFAKKLFDDIANIDVNKRLNAFIEKYSELFEFVSNDRFKEGMYDGQLDTPEIGNPLELTEEKLMHILFDIAESKYASRVAFDLAGGPGDWDGDR